MTAFAVAAGLAALVTGAAIVLRGATVAGGSALAPSDLLPLLFAGAALCTGLLLRDRRPPGAWIALVLAGGLAALEVIGVVRAQQETTAAGMWPWLVLGAEAAIVAAAWVAAAYAIHPRGQGDERRVLRLAVSGALGIVLVVASWAGVSTFGASVAAASASEPLRLSGRLALAFVAASVAIGAWRDLAGPLQRVRGRARTLRDLPVAIVDELLLTSAATRRRGREEERARLAADLHALVLPDLRRAAAAAASGAAPEPVAAGLRDAVDDVERLMHARHSEVLEQFGLVAALEWLAERMQQRSALDVEIELHGNDVGDPPVPPTPSDRAAFRIAMLALDNVVRHAGATKAVVRLAPDLGRLQLEVVDDGRGIEPAGDRTGRGLLDMQAEAREVGGSVRLEPLARGTRVVFSWSPRGAAEDHATDGRASTASPSAPPS